MRQTHGSPPPVARRFDFANEESYSPDSDLRKGLRGAKPYKKGASPPILLAAIERGKHVNGRGEFGRDVKVFGGATVRQLPRRQRGAKVDRKGRDSEKAPTLVFGG